MSERTLTEGIALAESILGPEFVDRYASTSGPGVAQVWTVYAPSTSATVYGFLTIADVALTDLSEAKLRALLSAEAVALAADLEKDAEIGAGLIEVQRVAERALAKRIRDRLAPKVEPGAVVEPPPALTAEQTDELLSNGRGDDGLPIEDTSRNRDKEGA